LDFGSFPIERQWKISAMLVKLGTSAPKAPDSPTPSAEKPEAPAAVITTKHRED
jgi:hypothetical protein